jgi:hypothetical protein
MGTAQMAKPVHLKRDWHLVVSRLGKTGENPLARAFAWTIGPHFATSDSNILFAGKEVAFRTDIESSVNSIGAKATPTPD